MRTGINTGLVVADEIDFEKNSPDVLGYTIDVASRISGLAETDDIIVSIETSHQAEGFFNFEKLDPAMVAGAEKPVQIYKVSSSRESLSMTHRLSGLRSELIGRNVEMNQLEEAVEKLKKYKSSIFSIIGDGGTGKSRLVEEFRNLLDPDTIQWIEGHSYGYSQNIPYFPLINLLSRAWQIREGDTPDLIRQKIDSGAQASLGERKDLVPYIGSLYSIPYTEIEQVSPEQWKTKLHEAIHMVLANLCRRGPTIICIEDLHWADPSSVELLRNILTDLKYPVIFLCLYRPGFNIFTSQQADKIKYYYEIRLGHLSPTDARSMVESILKTKNIPVQLQVFIRDKAEGNPFYLEEVINSLIETGTLIKDRDSWILTRELTEKDIPSTVQGIISARLDRLERETRRILQEASVIGRTFLYEILKRISDLKEYIDKSLVTLQHLDLIKTRSLQPELEYIFKHALTQEVVYNGLLMKERRLIHEKIGLVMEGLLQEHLPEFYETLAYHYSQSDNFQKAYEYLELSGDKAAKNYANNEAIRFYKEAIRMLDAQPDSLENRKEKLKVSIKMTVPLVFLSFPEDSLEILQNAEKLARELGDKEILLHICVYLSTYHTAKGNPSLGLEYAEKYFDSAEEIRDFKLVTQSAVQVCTAYWFAGDARKVADIGERAIHLLEEHHLEKDSFGMGYSPYSFICSFCGGSLGYIGRFKEGIDILKNGFLNACEVNDKWMMGFTRMIHGVLLFWAGYGEDVIVHAQEAIKIYKEAEIAIALDIAWQAIEVGYYLCGDYEKAIDAGEKSLKFARESGMPYTLAWCYTSLAMTLRAAGDLKRAREYAGEGLKISQECKCKSCEGFALVHLGCMADEMTPAIIDEAQNQIRSGIAIIEGLKLNSMIAFGYLQLGEFLSGAGRKAEALENLKKAETLYLEMEITPQSY
ncbi:MAG TPA: AAA family ATPase, partial [Bacteroidales bacterium]|nr:AAA family ATPase [Bacteroidales bacterium]